MAGNGGRVEVFGLRIEEAEGGNVDAWHQRSDHPVQVVYRHTAVGGAVRLVGGAVRGDTACAAWVANVAAVDGKRGHSMKTLREAASRRRGVAVGRHRTGLDEEGGRAERGGRSQLRIWRDKGSTRI